MRLATATSLSEARSLEGGSKRTLGFDIAFRTPLLCESVMCVLRPSGERSFRQKERRDVLPVHVYHILLQSRASHGRYTTREQLVDAWLVEERSAEQDPADLLEDASWMPLRPVYHRRYRRSPLPKVT